MRLNLRKAWLFSPAIDIFIFVLVPLLTYLFAVIFSGNDDSWGPYVTILMIVFEYSHLTTTAVPVYIRHKKQSMSSVFLVGLVTFIPLASIIIYNSNFTFFQTMAVVLVSQHIIRQMYGWLIVSQRDEEKSFIKFHDVVLFYGVTVFPFLYNYTESSAHERPFFFEPGDTQFLLFSSTIANIFYSCFLGSIVFFIIFEIKNILKTRELIITKYLIFFCAMFCFSYCYLLAPIVLYWLPQSIQHGVSYHVFNMRHIKNNLPGTIISKNYFYIPIFIILGGTHFYAGKIFFVDYELFTRFFWPLLWSIAFIHYTLDIFIWKGVNMRGVKL